MKLFEKVKNMFTEEVEEEKPIRREVRHVEIPTAKPVTKRENEEIEKTEEKKEDKLLFFDDKDFEDLEREEERIIKPLPKKEEPRPYQGIKPVISEEPKKVFKPSPIISPVYGVLDKNYKKEDIVTKRVPRSYHSENLTIDDVRDRAFSTLEDDLKNEIIEGDYITSKREVVEDELDIFKDIDEPEEIDNLKNDSINTKKEDIIEKEILEDDFLDDTEYLAQKLEEQKRKLDEINDIINDNNKVIKTRNVDEYLYREHEKIEEPSVEESIVEETEELPLHEINHQIIEEIEVNEQEENPKTLDEVYKDTLDDIDEASLKTKKKKTNKEKEDMSDSELLNLIDSMYEKSDEDE